MIIIKLYGRNIISKSVASRIKKNFSGTTYVPAQQKRFAKNIPIIKQNHCCKKCNMAENILMIHLSMCTYITRV